MIENLIKIRIIGVSLIIGASLLLSQKIFYSFLYPTAYAHFFLSYLYQFRAGKMTISYRIFWLFGLIVLGLCNVTFLQGERFQCLTRMYFLIHFCYDEIHLLSQRRDREVSHWIPLFIFITHIPSFVQPFQISFSIWDGYYQLMVILAIFAGVICLSQAKFRNRVSAYLWGLGCGFGLAGYFLGGRYFKNQMNVIIFFHFWIGYIHPLIRSTWSDPKKRKFIREILAANIGFGLLAMIYHRSGGVFLKLVFSENGFLLATCMHYVSTMRWPARLVLYNFRGIRFLCSEPDRQMKEST